jgi:hypothetical protein
VLGLLSLLMVFALLAVLVVLTDSVRSHTSCGCTGDSILSSIAVVVSLGRGQHTCVSRARRSDLRSVIVGACCADSRWRLRVVSNWSRWLARDSGMRKARNGRWGHRGELGGRHSRELRRRHCRELRRRHNREVGRSRAVVGLRDRARLVLCRSTCLHLTIRCWRRDRSA